uniref:Anthrax toxin receptor-like n=1 Tax=Callorhinus ursinus TaxID=34884 RepID=A0A3Q7NKP8_CALUR
MTEEGPEGCDAHLVGSRASKQDSVQDSRGVQALPLNVAFAENYELNVTGTGFNNARNKNEVICRFIFSENKFFDKKAASVEDTTMMCPGETIDNPDQVVFIEVSLNNGINFISNGANITSKNCVSAR